MVKKFKTKNRQIMRLKYILKRQEVTKAVTQIGQSMKKTTKEIFMTVMTAIMTVMTLISF